jgi:RNA polymerase sigma-70 factor (ECF subfamily)
LNNKTAALEPDILTMLNGCKKGEHLMQKQLYEHCYIDMMKVCLRYTKDIDKAAIVYNDAMLKVFKAIKLYGEQGKLMGWIKKIVVNTAIDFVRVKSNFLPVIVNEQNILDEHNIDNTVLEKMAGNEIRNLINGLPEKLAVVFNLYVYEEYDHNEIATLLAIPAGTSRYYLSEARKKLKEIVIKPVFSLNKAK